ncbi:hypothetical protein BDP55DRAFT_732657 [Colletotrichum godetiae]|uniref:DUF7702 domain-containing protein n=1 Tax=Colletotrichum godetiae TaxID=1209918 RepID=A0AAJ0ET95_9PEZI|nr:uncharacterized protein BDP55DRAFT_732657 [Colletotrichum godetiae]KAK1671050.1 hypothetical protein BDP55DRAFT_732657 [Colletotrichum godetiae]
MTRPFRYRDGVAIAQIIVFLLYLSFGILFCIQKRMGWFGISFISTIRIVGASCMLGTLANSSRIVWAAIFVCESLGLVFLTFVLLDLLKRVNSFTQVLTPWHFRIPELICYAGLGISIADYILAAKRTSNAMAPGALTKAGVGLFAALYFWGVLLFALLAKEWKRIPQAERRAMIGFTGCFPFMVVRISYTIAYVSTGEKRFSAVSGDTTIYLFMTVLMEFAVLGWVVWTIWGLDRVYEQVEGSRGKDAGEMEDLVESEGQRSRRAES